MNYIYWGCIKWMDFYFYCERVRVVNLDYTTIHITWMVEIKSYLMIIWQLKNITWLYVLILTIRNLILSLKFTPFVNYKSPLSLPYLFIASIGKIDGELRVLCILSTLLSNFVRSSIFVPLYWIYWVVAHLNRNVYT